MFESLFEMGGGYVLDFNNSSFALFVGNSILLDVYNGRGYEEYKSKANKLRQIWKDEPNSRVGKLLLDLLDYFEEYLENKYGEIPDDKQELIDKLQLVANNLKNDTAVVPLPNIENDTLKSIQIDIREALAKGQPETIIDRLHTFTVMYIRQISSSHNVEIMSKSGENYPLHSLIGNLCKYYKNNDYFESGFPERALKYSISLFESFNAVRNDKSLAHANDVLSVDESYLVVSIMTIILDYIRRIEEKNKIDVDEMDNDANQFVAPPDDDFVLPFDI